VTAVSRARVRAPELVGAGGWLNTGGVALSIAELRGKIVLLDFWTFCCINCLHVIDELRPLEATYTQGPDAVAVLIGVHSPKFVHEADHAAVKAAVERYDVDHPVLDDPDLTTWDAYTARAWPTLVVIDPEGYLVAQLSGEGHAHGLETLIDDLVREHDAKGTLRRGDAPFVPLAHEVTALRFPGKAIALPDGAFLVTDTGHHSLAVVEPDLTTVRLRIGDGRRGLVDGSPAIARFSEPQGLCWLPPEIATAVGYDIVVADTVNHALRGLRLVDWSVTTVAGSGRPRLTALDAGTYPASEIDLSSPWDVEWLPSRRAVIVAMAGTHQLTAFDPATSKLALLAGTGHEGLVDGPLDTAWFAQSSGLAADGDRLWVADSETSSIRYVDAGAVSTAVGQGLFAFGHRDGDAAQALLQHPLGVTALPDGSVAIADTYNGAIRRYEPSARTVSTIATGLAEPTDAVVAGDRLIVVESAAHRLTAIGLAARYLDVEQREYATRRTPIEVSADGDFALRVAFSPPGGQHFDDRDGPASRLSVDATPPALLTAGAGTGSALERTLVFARDVPTGVLHVTVRAATCDDDDEHAACHIHQQDWGLPVHVTRSGVDHLELMLRGLADTS
jgi:thiol-disulfide isomerase/thioredoxin